MKSISPDKDAMMEDILDEHLDGMLRLAYRRDAEQKIEEIIEESQRPFTPDEEAQIEAGYQQFLSKYAEYLRNQRKAGRRARLRRAIRRTIRAVSCLILALAIIFPVASSTTSDSVMTSLRPALMIWPVATIFSARGGRSMLTLNSTLSTS